MVAIEVLGAGAVALLCSLGATHVMRWFALRRGVVRDGGGRHAHRGRVPLLGGVGPLIVIVGVLLLHPTLVLTEAIAALLLGLLAIVLFGAADDRFDLPWWAQLLAQGVAVTMFVVFGRIELSYINAPFVDATALRLDGIPMLATGIVVLWMLFVMNAVNWLDGVDGAATGVSALALLVLAFLAMTTDVLQPPVAIIAVVGAGAAIGFLAWNRPPARIFLGTSGSVGFGFLIAALAVIAGAKIATTATVLLLPFADMVAVLVKRIIRGEAMTRADTSHLHHVLSRRGLRKRTIFFLHILTASIAGALAMLLPHGLKTVVLVGGFVFLVALILALDPPTRDNAKEASQEQVA